VGKIISDVMEYCCLFAKHFLDLISLNMADTSLVKCLYKSPWTFHLYERSFSGP